MAEIKVIVNEYWTYLSACLHYHLLVIVLLLIASPVPITAVIINHDAYIWQRLWTPALKQAISTASPYIQSWHVLAGQLEANGQMIPVNVDIKALVASRKPVILVFRINGQLAFKPNPDLIAQLVQIIHTYRFQDLNVSGIEIDYDCPTNKLLSYKQFLIALRAALLDQQLPLMITALPTWLNSYDLTSLLQQADAVILQVHAVLNPVQGLFNPDLALRWVEKFSLISPIKFQVALPNYGSRVSWDEQGRLTGVESENNLGLFGHTMQELKVKPEQVSRVLNVWQRSAPKNFAGVVWFRLPTSEDQRAWSLSTWLAVLKGQTLQPAFATTALASTTIGVYDLSVSNTSDIDASPPAKLQLQTSGQCSAFDLFNHYQLQQNQGDYLLYLVHPLLLPAHQTINIGWARCPEQEVEIHVVP